MKKLGLPVLGLWLLILTGCPSQPPTVPEPDEWVPLPGETDLITDSLSQIRSFSDIPKVLALIESTVSVENMSRSDLLTYGDLLLSQNRLNDAAEAYEKVLIKDPENTASLYSLALIKGVQGQSDQQNKLLKAVLEKDPQHSGALASLGRLYYEKKDVATAKNYFERSLEAEANLEAYLGLGLLELEQGRPGESERLMQRAVVLEPNSDLAAGLYATALGANKKYFDAEKEYGRAIALAPRNQWNYLDRGRLRWLNLLNPQAALEDLNRAVELDPGNYYAHLYRAEVYEALEKAPGAYDDLMVVFKATPAHRAIYPSLAIMSFAVGDYNTAAKVAMAAALDHPGEYAFPWIAALSHRALKQTKEAEQLLDREIRRFPPNSLIADTFKFLRNPRSNTTEFTLTNKLKTEKDQLLKTRIHFYMGAQYYIDNFPASARANLDLVSQKTLRNVPEIMMAKLLLEQLRS